MKEPARYAAQKIAITRAWDALIEIVEAHTAQQIADALRADPASPLDAPRPQVPLKD